MQLIVKLFQVHFTVHGTNFSRFHKFLIYFIQSFFYATNPGEYFQSCISSIISDIRECKKIRFKYEKRNGVLMRYEYWKSLINFAMKLLINFNQAIPLLQDSVRYLINELAKFNSSAFPFNEIFIFDAMFCGYLENPLFNEDYECLRDVCQIFRCLFSQKIVPCKLYSTLKIIDPNFETYFDLVNFIENIKIDKLKENDQLTNAIGSCDEFSVYSPHDLNLIFTLVQNFCEIGIEDSSINEIKDAYKGLDKLTSDSHNEVLSLKSWASSTPKLKVELISTDELNDIIDCISTIKCGNLNYTNPKELADLSLLYCGNNNLSWIQKVRISVVPQIINSSELDKILNNIKLNNIKSKELLEILFSNVFTITVEFDRIHLQVNSLISILIRSKIIPRFLEKYPSDFDFNSQDMYQSRSVINNIYNAFDTKFNSLNIQQKNRFILQKNILMMYIDQLELMYSLQKSSKSNIESKLVQYVKNCDISDKNLPKYKEKIAEKGLLFLKNISVNNLPSLNFIIVLKAMKMFKNFNDNFIKYQICLSDNPAIFCFYNLLSSYITGEKFFNYICDTEDINLMMRFIRLTSELWKSFI